MQMKEDARPVTKQELYSVAATVCTLIFFVGVVSDGDGRFLVALCAIVLAACYMHKRYVQSPYR